MVETRELFPKIAQIGLIEAGILWMTLAVFSSVCETAPTTSVDTAIEIPSEDEFSNYTSFDLHYLEGDTVQSTKYSSYQLNELWNDTHFNASILTAIYIHGFHTFEDSPHAKDMVESFVLFRKNYNMISLVWDHFAWQDYFKVASPMAKIYGKWCGQLLYNSSLESSQSLDPSKLHLIGTSLGAHIAGGLGQAIFHSSGSKVGRLTGLDPAGPNFDGDVPNAESAMTKDDAEFCDVWHGDAGFYGMNRSMGHCDFWPNNGIRTQPGCPFTDAPPSQDDFSPCNHDRPPMLFIESVRNSNRASEFWAMKRHSNGTWDPTDLMPMGLNCPSTAKGNYYLRTAGQSPFSLGINGITDL